MTIKPSKTWALPQSLWERQKPYIDVDKRQLSRFLSQTIGAGSVVSATVLGDGAFNTNLRVDVGSTPPVVVRIYEQDDDGWRRDRRIAELVGDQVPLAAMLGAAELAGRPAAVFEWIDGVYPSQACRAASPAERDGVAYALGQVLARLAQAHRFPAHGLLDGDLNYRRRFSSNGDSLVEFIDWSLRQGRAGQRLGPALAQRLQGFVEERADLLAATEDHYGLVHGDFRAENILMSNDGARWVVRAVLDWEYALAGSAMLDFGVLLRGRRRGDPFGQAMARGFLEAGGDLPRQWEAIARLLDLRNLCGFLNASKHRGGLFAAIRREILHILDER